MELTIQGRKAFAYTAAHDIDPAKRSIVFAFFGSEEAGSVGARFFLANATVPLDRIIANLQFEMIGRSDPAVADHTLWLTGWERTDLGPALAAQGARLVRDPHTKENFFLRSDNITLARRGVIAQTVSSYGLHEQYHQPDDDIAHIDFRHMTDSIRSVLRPVQWLANSKFRPQWLPGGRPPAGRGGPGRNYGIAPSTQSSDLLTARRQRPYSRSRSAGAISGSQRLSSHQLLTTSLASRQKPTARPAA